MKHLFRLLILVASLLTTPILLADVVNINKATAAALQENLRGIGEKKAQAIVAYRKEYGAFKTLDEIMEVKGIGKGIFKKIKSSIALDKGITDLLGNEAAKPAVKKSAKKSVKKPAVKQAADKKVKPVEKNKKVKQDAKTKRDKVKKS